MKIVSYTSAAHSSGKFIQFMLRGQEYLVFAPFSLCTYHVDILQRFLEDEAVPHKPLSQDYILVKESTFNMIGGGRYQLDSEAKTLVLSDNSQAFGRFSEIELDNKIAGAGHDWSAYRLTIR
jgi:hypothetical protein